MFMPNVLLVYPKNPTTFWSFDEALKMVGRKSAFPPLGLLTIAGMMPAHYALRLVDMNLGPLRDEDLAWADVVLTSSMIIHWAALEGVIDQCNQAGVSVLNGGPLPTQYADDIEGKAVFYRGEAENGFLDIVERLVAAPGSVPRQVIDRRGRFEDLAKTPLPRWDLIRFSDYQTMVVQMTRGCPESCTFCNIPSLYGKKTRIKTKSRMMQELDILYESGWRGVVMVVDDNFIGNRDAIRTALEEEVIPWQHERGYPFSFCTQASIRVADDPALLQAMYLAGFDEVFVGIESPVEESLKFMGAQKNLQGDTPLLNKIRTLQRHGFQVMAGFIIGLDTDPDDIADRMIRFIQEAGIPIAMVGILGVLRDTPDYKRFQRTGRLIENVKYSGNSGIFSRQLSFVPKLAPEELLHRHRVMVETLNSPAVFFERCLTHFQHQGRQPLSPRPLRVREVKAFFRSLWRQGIAGHYRWAYWAFLLRVLTVYPTRFSEAVRLAVQGHHLILTTQEALQADELRTFCTEALERLERFCQGYQETFQMNVGTYASRLMQRVHAHFEQFQDDHQTLQHNATILVQAAQAYYDAARKSVRHQTRESLEGFFGEIERLLTTHPPDDGSVSQVR